MRAGGDAPDNGPDDRGSEAPRQLLAVAVEAAEAGAEELRRHFRRRGLEVQTKAPNDFVTAADHASERRVIEVIRSHFPSHRILAEESGWVDGAAAGDAVEWIIDPLDGTSNFLHGLPYFCVSIGVRSGGRTVAGVILEPLDRECFTARRGAGAFWNDRPMRVAQRAGIDGSFLATGYPFRAQGALDHYLAAFRDISRRARGIRRCGAAALDLAYTAAGVYDGFFELRLAPWDVAAGVHLIEEAAGVATDLDGGDGVLRGGNVVAGSAPLHAELRAVMAAHMDESTLDRVQPRNSADPSPVS